VAHRRAEKSTVRPSDDERELVHRLAGDLRHAPADADGLSAWIHEVVDAAGADQDYAQALIAAPLPAEPSEWAALASLAVAIRTGHLSIVDGDEIIGWEPFEEYAGGLGLDGSASRLVYEQLDVYWREVHPRPRPGSRVATYLGLHAGGLTTRTEVLRQPSGAMALRLGSTPSDAVQVQQHVIREPTIDSALEFVEVDVKLWRDVCCPPFADPRWEERFDFFGENSRLAQIVDIIRRDVIDRIRRTFQEQITPDLVAIADAFGVGNAALYDTAAAGPPFMGSGEAIQRLIDLGAKTTQADALVWLVNLRRQLEQVRDRLRVVSIESYIDTGSVDIWNSAAGDGSQVFLRATGPTGPLANLAPAPSGGGFPISTYNYNADTEAFEFFGSAHVWETPIPYAGGILPALDVTGFQLEYGSTDGWFFSKAQLFFRYEVNGHSRLLTDDQPATDEKMRDDDLVHDDQAPGWVNFGDQFNFGVQPGSRLADAQRKFARLTNALNVIEAGLHSADLTNVYLTRGNDIITLLREAAVFTRQGEHGLARARYQQVLGILGALDPAHLGALDRELLFAVHVLIAASFVSSGALPHAYAELVIASGYAVGDTIASSYVWHALAALFLQWGDQLYAAAGGNYEARLLALDRYRKVLADGMRVTYADGREDEVLKLWLDFSTLGRTVPAVPAAWVASLRLRMVSFVGSGKGASPVYSTPLPVRSWQVLADQGPAGGGFLRVQFDVSEVRPTRPELDFVVSISASEAARWGPSGVRLQAQVASYNPTTTPSGLFGPRADVLVRRSWIGNSTVVADRVTWTLRFGGVAAKGMRLIPAPAQCAARLVQRQARLRIDQIRAHLNVYGLHDEYVPNGRFQAVARLAENLADRASYFSSRYIDFLAKAESSALEELDAAFMAELSEANLDLARQRRAEAGAQVDAAVASVAAAGTALGLATQTLAMFEQTYQIGLLRFMNSISLNIWPPGVGLNLGSFVGSVSGADGYDQTFHTRDLEYRASVERSRAAADAAEFHRRIADIERLIADETLAIEQMRQANVIDRLDFLRNRTLSATAWYQMAALYRELFEVQVQMAARWAWIAERALEFELNTAVSIVRMDYHLVALGAERLRADLDRLRTELAEFRERFRDIPNIVEREFRFSIDFPQQFRALTSQAPTAPAEALAPGVRAVEFHTTMAQYDVRLPGRYAFGRILGVELELQTDIAVGVFTGHLENAREIRTTVPMCATSVQVSESLVRVPIPDRVEPQIACPPTDELDNSSFTEVNKDLELSDTLPDLVRKGKLNPLLTHAFEQLAPSAVPVAEGPAPLPNAAERLVKRARSRDVELSELTYVADSLVGGLEDVTPDELRALRVVQLEALRPLFASRRLFIGPGDLNAFLELQPLQRVLDRRVDVEVSAQVLGTAGRRTWERYEVPLEFAPASVVYRDVTPGHGELRQRPLDVLPDYLNHPPCATRYGLRLKRHDAESMTLSTYRVREDAAIFNPYNPGDQLGTFENTGIDTHWRLTLRALPLNALNATPQWDKIREVVFRVWYHAAYERLEGALLANALEPGIIRWNASKVFTASLYRDFYDEFQTLVGDYDETDPQSLPAVRAFTDDSHPATGGWIPFVLDDGLIPAAGQRIAAVLVVFTASQPSVFPAYVWRLRRGPSGPVVQGSATEAPGPLTARLSAHAPAGFGGVDASATWYLRLARADNPGRSLDQIRDVEIIFELEPS
jgi:hypothetical protein